MRLAVFTIIGLLALAAWSASEHAQPNANLPLVHAALKVSPQQDMLFSPCPIGPRNFPRWKERKA